MICFPQIIRQKYKSAPYCPHIYFFLLTYISRKGKAFFNLAEYQKEIGKDYIRITFYLCDETELNTYKELQRVTEKNEYDESNDDVQQVSDDPISAEEIEKILQVDTESAIKNESCDDTKLLI